MATLNDIKTKVRRLTRSPSDSQLTDNQLEQYINDFILYDFPEHVRLFTFRRTLTFYTSPYVDTYSTTTADPNSPLYDFKNKYVTVHNPVYVGGSEAYYTQSREDFFKRHPRFHNVRKEHTGDGTTATFNGQLDSVPVLRNHVLFTSVDTNNNGMVLRDEPTANTTGDLVDSDTGSNQGNIDYVTGTYNITFPNPPGANEDISSQTVPYRKSKPHAVLYYDNTFTLRPVPDKPYPVNLEVYVVPSALENDADRPELDQYWEYIAYGAARKVFEDRMDSDSLGFIIPIFKEKERLILRRTLVQQSNERVSTIYQTYTGYSWQGPNDGAL